MDATLLCGTYTPDAGNGEGIYALAMDASGRVSDHRLVARADSPSFIATHPNLPVVYAACESDGTVRAWSVSDVGDLEPLGDGIHAGEAVCHVVVDPRGRYLVASCYGDGSVVYVPLRVDGGLGSPVVAEAAHDPHAAEKVADRVSRAHAALVLHDGRVLTIDIGFDLLRVWDVGDAGLELAGHGALPLGSGPRHAVQHPAGEIYTISEYSTEIFVSRADSEGNVVTGQHHPATFADYAGPAHGCEVTLTDDGRVLHATTRGPNVITTFSIHDEGQRLVPVGDTPCEGDWPRHQLEYDGRLYVANQFSDSVTAFVVDPQTGTPTYDATHAIGTPACLIPAAQR